MPKHRKKTRVVDCWRSLCVRATPTGSGAANRPAQVFDLSDMEQVEAGGKSVRSIAAQAQDLTLIAICAYRQDSCE
jgi:hypothetical protein